MVKASGSLCRPTHRFDDPARDSRSYIDPQPRDRRASPPTGDLRKLGVRVDETGLCVTFTTGAPLAERSEVSFVAHGPMIAGPSGGSTSYGYGVIATLRDGGLAMHYGLQGQGPNQVRGVWAQDENTLSLSVPRSELERAPTNMVGRPPFPLNGFTFQARVTSPFDNGSLESDELPDTRAGDLGLVNGRVCPDPCSLGTQ